MTSLINVQIGHSIACSIVYLDADGNKITATPDSPPVWTQTAPTVETLTASADGLTASTKALTAGADTISVTATVGGQSFVASLAVESLAQVLSSVQIVPVVS